MVPGLGEDLGQFRLQTQELLRVFDARHLGRAVDLVHLVGDLVIPANMYDIYDDSMIYSVYKVTTLSHMNPFESADIDYSTCLGR